MTAHLARLQLSEEEATRFAAAVLQMLDYFSKMREMDVGGLEPTTHVLLRQNRVRQDEPAADRPGARIDPDRLLENAPQLEDRLITIPNVL